MKEFKGTPGPWEFIFDCDDYHDNGRIAGKDGFDVCSFGNSEQYYPTDGEAPSDCDMQLILASPDLLTALQQLVEVYDSEDGKQCTTTSKREALENARAAIDKAMGE